VELSSHFLHITKSIQYLSVYIRNLLYRNYCISSCLCAGLVQLQSIPQVHYINNVTSHNNNSHAIHTILICIYYICGWFLLGKLNDKYHIIFLTYTVFNAAVLCTTSVLQSLLLPQMKQERKEI